MQKTTTHENKLSLKSKWINLGTLLKLKTQKQKKAYKA
jgi:hypothetical protein